MLGTGLCKPLEGDAQAAMQEFTVPEITPLLERILAAHRDGLDKHVAKDLVKQHFLDAGGVWSEALDQCRARSNYPVWKNLVDWAYVQLVKRGVAEASTGRDLWALIDEDQAVPDGDGPPPEIVEASLLQRLVRGEPTETGFGDECVYAYSHPSDLELARLNQSAVLPVKIGYTKNADPRPRIVATLQQARTALHEGVHLLLVIRCDNAKALEKAIHGTLEVRGQKIAGDLGAEWFRTDPKDIEQIASYVLDPMRGRRAKIALG